MRMILNRRFVLPAAVVLLVLALALGPKPGTIAATRPPSVANRLAWAHWRRDQRPVNPSEIWRVSTGRCRAASRLALSRWRRSVPLSDAVIEGFPRVV